jgi:hypothetical protein
MHEMDACMQLSASIINREEKRSGGIGGRAALQQTRSEEKACGVEEGIEVKSFPASVRRKRRGGPGQPRVEGGWDVVGPALHARCSPPCMVDGSIGSWMDGRACSLC